MFRTTYRFAINATATWGMPETEKTRNHKCEVQTKINKICNCGASLSERSRDCYWYAPFACSFGHVWFLSGVRSGSQPNKSISHMFCGSVTVTGPCKRQAHRTVQHHRLPYRREQIKRTGASTSAVYRTIRG